MENVTTEVTKAKRPGFLTTICILSFIGIGFAIIGAFGSIALTPVDGIISLVCQALCLIGVIMMWQLKKTGFYLYVIGEIVPSIYTLIVYGGVAASIPFLGDAVLMLYILSFGFPVAFIIMYAANLKHMK